MSRSDVQILFDAVRRRLWRGQFVAAARWAAWGSAAVMLLSVTVHLAVRQVPAGAVLWAIAVLWAALLARAAWRRASDPDCALWADRHLGGACAYTTLLETGPGAPGAASAPAVRWLENWAQARVPAALRLLAARHEPMHLSRPLLAMLVCAALGVVVMALPDAAPSSGPPIAASAASSLGDRPMALAEAPATGELASEVALALRSAESREAQGGGQAGGAPAAGAGQPDDASGRPASQTGAAPPGEPAPGRDASSSTAVDAAPTAGATRTTGAAAGREVGDSRDERAELGVSRGLRGSIAVQRSAVGARRPSTEKQADMDRLATYDEVPAAPGAAAMRVGPAPAAATPPAATESTRLTSTETTYVQAWLKANPRSR